MCYHVISFTPALVYRVELARHHLLLLLPPPVSPSPRVGGGRGAGRAQPVPPRAVRVPCVGQAGNGRHLSPLTLAGAAEESERQKNRKRRLVLIECFITCK